MPSDGYLGEVVAEQTMAHIVMDIERSVDEHLEAQARRLRDFRRRMGGAMDYGEAAIVNIKIHNIEHAIGTLGRHYRMMLSCGQPRAAKRLELQEAIDGS